MGANGVQHVIRRIRSASRLRGSAGWRPWRADRAASPARRKLRAPVPAHNCAVISEPERSAASITTTPRASPEISRLRRGKWRGSGAMPSGISDTSDAAPRDLVVKRLMFRRIDDIDAAGENRDRAGFERRRDAPRDRCRAPGRKRPQDPRAPRSAAIVPANLIPSAEALRAPTIATMSRLSSARLPEHRNERRRRIERGEARRKIRFDGGDDPSAQSARARRFRLSPRLRSECAILARRRGAPSAAPHPAPRAHRKARHQRGKCGGSDRSRCAQAAARRVVRRRAELVRAVICAPILGSSPRSRRAILARCEYEDQHRQHEWRTPRTDVHADEQEIDRRHRGREQRGNG